MSAASVVMLRRNFRHTLRNPVAVFNGVLFPLIMMLLFVYVLGGAFDVGSGAGVDYISYVTPGMIGLAICYGLSPTALSVNSDMTTGIINRFKVMDISRGAVLTGHVVASVLRTAIAIAAIIGLAFLIGFRPQAGLLGWLGAIGMILLVCVATTWLTVALGLNARNAESAGLSTVPLIMLPFLSSAIVPAGTMGPGVRQFAEYQPFTPIIEALRGLLAGTPASSTILVATAWCVGITLVGYFWALSIFSKRA